MTAYSNIASATYVYENCSLMNKLVHIKIHFSSIFCQKTYAFTIDKQIVVQTVKPQTPERTGELSIICNLILMRTSINVTNIPTLPGYASGGIKKLNQLNTTIIDVGIKT